MDAHGLDTSTKLIVSGGDDGSIAILLTSASSNTTYKAAPVLLQRTHASAVTACAILAKDERILIATSGNDQWLRLWEVHVGDNEDDTMSDGRLEYDNKVDIRRMGKIKTNVADVSSMAVVAAEDGGDARVLICGVGVEVVRVRWDE
jgi:WD40 repeat protein